MQLQNSDDAPIQHLKTIVDLPTDLEAICVVTHFRRAHCNAARAGSHARHPGFCGNLVRGRLRADHSAKTAIPPTASVVEPSRKHHSALVAQDLEKVLVLRCGSHPSEQLRNRSRRPYPSAAVGSRAKTWAQRYAWKTRAMSLSSCALESGEPRPWPVPGWM